MSGTTQIRTSWLAIVIVAAVLVGAIGGYALGAGRSSVVSRVGVASAAESAISVEEAGAWTYSVPLDGAWIDESGSLHVSGRPACLAPGNAGIALKFYSVDVDIAGSLWRQVVLVDCR